MRPGYLRSAGDLGQVRVAYEIFEAFEVAPVLFVVFIVVGLDFIQAFDHGLLEGDAEVYKILRDGKRNNANLWLKSFVNL